MALDGIVVADLVSEFSGALTGGKINKIAQPEKDELLFTIKNKGNTYRLSLSASASLPLACLTEENKTAPYTAPNFCMVLRKYIGSGRIARVSQPGLERVIDFTIEHLDEMGDPSCKHLYVELMGKHSNIIFCRDDGVIIDSIKHISAQVSSVREVLPGRMYFIPQTTEKADPLTVTCEDFAGIIGKTPAPLYKALYQKLTGISPVMASELCFRAGLDEDISANAFGADDLDRLYAVLSSMMDDVKAQNFTPNIVYLGGEPEEYASLPLTSLECADSETLVFSSVSRLLWQFYSEKSIKTRIRQKSADLRKIIQTALERSNKKYDLQERQLKGTLDRDRYRVYGELLNTYGYGLQGGETELRCPDSYTGEEVVIPLDPKLSAQENAQKYFNRYQKLKRTNEALTGQLKETAAVTEHLESIRTSLDLAEKEEDLVPIREELMDYGFIRRRPSSKKNPKNTSRPYHYISSDGFDIYVGKNNYQNEEVTFRIADGDDWWFHAKNIPGSHVIVKTGGKELPDKTFTEAASLAAYYSKGRDSEKVEIDYTQRKNLKKVNGGPPGFVIYHTNYSLMAEPRADLERV